MAPRSTAHPTPASKVCLSGDFHPHESPQVLHSAAVPHAGESDISDRTAEFLDGLVLSALLNSGDLKSLFRAAYVVGHTDGVIEAIRATSGK
jgi:hypothetical protein